MNIRRLKGKMVENGISVQAMAKLLNIDRTTFYRKLRTACGEKITIGEAKKIAQVLNLNCSEASDIFLS